jgi:hypothetical protein
MQSLALQPFKLSLSSEPQSRSPSALDLCIASIFAHGIEYAAEAIIYHLKKQEREREIEIVSNFITALMEDHCGTKPSRIFTDWAKKISKGEDYPEEVVEVYLRLYSKWDMPDQVVNEFGILIDKHGSRFGHFPAPSAHELEMALKMMQGWLLRRKMAGIY